LPELAETRGFVRMHHNQLIIKGYFCTNKKM
jgi:hypothetical protein